jgi:hypothetical protein
MHQEKVIVSWDDASQPEKWRVELFRMNENGCFVHAGGSNDDGFPVNVDDFGPFDEDLLLQSVRQCFPDAKYCLIF